MARSEVGGGMSSISNVLFMPCPQNLELTSQLWLYEWGTKCLQHVLMEALAVLNSSNGEIRSKGEKWWDNRWRPVRKRNLLFFLHCICSRIWRGWQPMAALESSEACGCAGHQGWCWWGRGCNWRPQYREGLSHAKQMQTAPERCHAYVMKMSCSSRTLNDRKICLHPSRQPTICRSFDHYHAQDP